MFNLEHLLLFSILFFLSYVLTLLPSKDYEKNFWKTVSFFIIAYTIIVGFREGWGHDYYRYESAFNTIETDYSYDYDIAFWDFYRIVKAFGLPFSGWLVISTLTIIVSYFYIVKAMKGDKYMLMLFLPATITITTYAMRQFQAIAYINIAIGLMLFSEQLLKRKKLSIIMSVLLLLLAYHTHASSIIYALPFLPFIFYKKTGALPYKITIIAYLGCIGFSGIINAVFSDILLDLMQNLTVTDHLQGYVDHAEGRVLGSDAADEATYGYGGAFQLFHYVAYIALFYVTGKALKIAPNKNVTIIYNIVVVALLLQEIFFVQEIMKRLIMPFYILYFIPLGYAINIYIQYKNKHFKGYQIYGICILLVLLRIYYPMYSFLTSFKLAGFVWN